MFQEKKDKESDDGSTVLSILEIFLPSSTFCFICVVDGLAWVCGLLRVFDERQEKRKKREKEKKKRIPLHSSSQGRATKRLWVIQKNLKKVGQPFWLTEIE